MSARRPNPDPSRDSDLIAFLGRLPSAASPLLEARGGEMVERLGIQAVKDVILDVLCGVNVRASTELLTRRRVALLNAATVALFVRSQVEDRDFPSSLHALAARGLRDARLSRGQRWLLQWTLGLTDKAFQNVLRDDRTGLELYRQRFADVMSEVSTYAYEQYGPLEGQLSVGGKGIAPVSWPFMLALLATIGAQTLAIRGSEKSLYGKLFERLVLVALLQVLGYSLIERPQGHRLSRVFWLTSQDEKRESDATLIHSPGKGVRFDIGFIGRGNTEISLDKISRFERTLELGKSTWYMGTIVIVDSVGRGSRIATLAEGIGGTIVQMSMQYWPRDVALALSNILGAKPHEIAQVPDAGMRAYLEQALANVPDSHLIGGAAQVAAGDGGESESQS